VTDCKQIIDIFLSSNEKQKKASLKTVPKYNLKIVETSKIDSPNTHIHDCLLSWPVTGGKKWQG
jgi:hypothetical protein